MLGYLDLDLILIESQGMSHFYSNLSAERAVV